MSDSSAGRNLAAEFVGTTIVMLAGPGLLVLAPDSASVLTVALGTGIAMALAIGVIGAVANPMLSLALWFAKAIPGNQLVGDLVGQFTGAVFGAAILFGFNNSSRFAVGTNGWQPDDNVATGVDIGLHVTGFASLGTVVAAELLLGVIVTVVFLSAISQQRSNGAVAAFTGGAFVVASLLLFDVSGIGVNPARSLGAAIFADTDPNALGQVWLFIVVPIAAAFIALFVWLMIDEATIDDTILDDTFVDDLADKAADIVR